MWQKIILLALAGVLGRGRAEVQGTVRDFSHNPISGAKVTFRHLTKTDCSFGFETDADGNFSVDTIPNGPYYISVSAAGFRSLIPAIFEVHFPEFSIAFQMTPQPPSEPSVEMSGFWGELQNESGPLVGVRVCIVRGQEAIRCQITNRLGQYGFTVPSGEYLGIITRANQVIARKALQLRPGPNSDLLAIENANMPER
jgi:hypothetical protein